MLRYERTARANLQEKILPFYSPEQAVKLPGEAGPLDDVEAEVAALCAERGAEASATSAVAPEPVAVGEVCHGVGPDGAPVEEWDYLNRFFKRFNKALLDKTAVEREAARLSQVRLAWSCARGYGRGVESNTRRLRRLHLRL